MAMSKAEQEEARRQLKEDDKARQNQSHGPAWKPGQKVGDK